MLSVTEFNDVQHLATLAPTWRRLLAETPGADFFRTREWFEVYWRHYGADQQLRLLLVEQSGEPVGILPLTVTTRSTRIGRLRALGFPLDFWGSFYGAVGPDPALILQVGLRHVMNTPRDWDFLDLRWLHDSARGSGALVSTASELGMDTSQRKDNRVAIADLSAGWEAYWASRSRNWRSNCRRNAKKTEAAGDVEIIRYRPLGEAQGESDPRWDLFDAVHEIAMSSWQAGSTDGTTMSHDNVRCFLREMHIAAVNAGCLDLNLLTIDGAPAAFNYNYHCDGYVSSFRLGFDPALASAGLGTTLTWRMLEDSCARGDHTIDFLPGSLKVKRPWQTSIEDSVQVEHFPRQFGRTELIRAKRWLDDTWQTARERFSLAH